MTNYDTQTKAIILGGIGLGIIFIVFLIWFLKNLTSKHSINSDKSKIKSPEMTKPLPEEKIVSKEETLQSTAGEINNNSINKTTEAHFISDGTRPFKHSNPVMTEKETENVEITKASDNNYNDSSSEPLIIPDLNEEKSNPEANNNDHDNKTENNASGLSW